MKLRKVTAMLSALVMMVSTVGMTVSAASFPDVKSTDWYYGYVTDVSEKGYITGYADGKFGATDNLTRGQFATILYRMEESPEVVFSGAFPDVTDGVFYSDPAEWANKEGLITGYATGAFGPVDNLTREQLATIMYRYAKWEGQDVSNAGSLTKFPDGSKVSAFAEDAMEWAVGEGIISGNADGTLAPQGTVSRAVAATIISRYTSSEDAGDNTPTTPSEPEEPGKPSEPSNPDKPSEPEQPDTPVNPDKPNPDTPSEPSDPDVHIHNWEPITVQEPVYGPLFIAICDKCGKDISGPGEDVEHFDASMEKFLNGEISFAETCRTQTVTFTGETGIVAYETKIIGYKCVCGETK